MLRFFRQIRQRLLTDNKFSKYLLYAVGEILLVVIGILFALQIDTWREQKSNQEIRKSYIESFKRDLSSDIIRLQSLNADMQADIEYTMDLFNRISSDSATKDTLIRIIRKEYNPYFNPSNSFNTATFERINVNGHMDLLDSTLSSAILEHRARQLQALGMLDRNIETMFNIYELNIKEFPNLPDTTAFGNPLFSRNMGQIEQRFWREADQNRLFASLSSLLITKLQEETIIVGVRKQMIVFTQQLLQQLENVTK